VTAPTKAVIARSVEIMRDLRERYPRSAAGKIHPNNFVKLAERLAWEGIVHPDDIARRLAALLRTHPVLAHF
jgi:hypothetical protein